MTLYSKFSWRLKTTSQNLSSTFSSFTIQAKNTCDRTDIYGRYVSIYFFNLLIEENKTYKFGSFQKDQVSCAYSENSKEFYSDSTMSGSITIRKFDPILKVLSGNFDATLKQRDSSKTVIIRHGTFDVTLM